MQRRWAGSATAVILLLVSLCSTSAAWAQTEMFLADGFRDIAIRVFDYTADGNVLPLRSIAGPDTGFVDHSRVPAAVAVDSVHNEVIVVVVSSQGEGVFVYPRNASGNVAPTRTIAGPDTGLLYAYEVTVDLDRDELYVSMLPEVEGSATPVLVFDRGATGNVAPKRRLWVPNLGPRGDYSGVTEIAVDPVHDELLVLTPFNLLVYDRNASGSTPPIRVLQLPERFVFFDDLKRRIGYWGLALDLRRNEIFIGGGQTVNVPCCSAVNVVDVFDRSASGAAAPLRTLEGPNTGLEPVAVALDLARDELIVANGPIELRTSITIYPLTAGGNTAPLRKITSREGSTDRIWTLDDLAVSIDTTRPIIEAKQLPPPNGNGWNNSAVQLSWNVYDLQSDIAVKAGCDPFTYSTETPGTPVTCFAVDAAGLAAAGTTTLRIDLTAPTVAAVPSRPPDNGGWYNHPFTVAWVGSDSLSGIANCDAAAIYAGPDTPGSTLTGTCRDRADNVASASYAFKYDASAPTCTVTATPSALSPPDHRLVPVTVHLSTQDSGAGIDRFVLVSATSNEPDNALGDGDKPRDIQGWVIGTADTTGFLRAERSGTGAGRVYQLTYDVFDQAGNSGRCTASVSVAHP